MGVYISSLHPTPRGENLGGGTGGVSQSSPCNPGFPSERDCLLESTLHTSNFFFFFENVVFTFFFLVESKVFLPPLLIASLDVGDKFASTLDFVDAV